MVIIVLICGWTFWRFESCHGCRSQAPARASGWSSARLRSAGYRLKNMKTRLLALKTISLIPISFQLMGTKNTWWVQLRHYSARWQPCCRMCRSDQENLYLYPISQGVTTCDPNSMKPTSDTATASVQVVSHTLLCTWRLGAFCFQHQPIKSRLAMMFIIIIIANAFVI